MEYTPRKYKRKCRKNVNLFHDLLHVCSQSSASSFSSSSSKSHISPFRLFSKKFKKKRETTQNHQKRDYLTKLFEKKKLKDKSLAEKMKTPLDRKLYRTCWPIELSKLAIIKDKPQEKRKKKPNYKSLRRKKFPHINVIQETATKFPEKSSLISCSESKSEDESLIGVHQFYRNYFIYEPVTPRMLIDILQDSEYLGSGMTSNTIIGKLRALKINLNPRLDLLKEEVIEKLNCATELGLIEESNGYYRISDNFQTSKLSRRVVNDFWELWYAKMAKKRHYL